MLLNTTLIVVWWLYRFKNVLRGLKPSNIHWKKALNKLVTSPLIQCSSIKGTVSPPRPQTIPAKTYGTLLEIPSPVSMLRNFANWPFKQKYMAINIEWRGMGKCTFQFCLELSVARGVLSVLSTPFLAKVTMTIYLHLTQVGLGFRRG